MPASYGDVADLLSGSGFAAAGRWEPPVPDELKTRWTSDRGPTDAAPPPLLPIARRQ